MWELAQPASNLFQNMSVCNARFWSALEIHLDQSALLALLSTPLLEEADSELESDSELDELEREDEETAFLGAEPAQCPQRGWWWLVVSFFLAPSARKVTVCSLLLAKLYD